ncbi:uncharacterized protein at1g65760 [Phtheirospermum japonicum]|uniref:Uncharacterized protein at1g65760 n=1 Tax=Phtheirospermum japonicum TaxID=374723 RepID=A0A830CNC4_9LAMI|nr:uncharacterized protein at1g65760 [Phtheirospermum japonicum]
MADWSGLPYDIIHKVTTYLIAVEDFVSFSCVCPSWRSVYLSKQWNQVPQVPFLMFSDNENNGRIRSLLSLCTNKVYKSDLPEASGSRCWGSSLGWLVTLGPDLNIHLLNPLTRVSIDLPHISSLQTHSGEILDQQEFIEKAFVFNKPRENEPDLLVMIIYGPLGRLGFCRPGYSSWICIGDDDRGGFIDALCMTDRIIALSNMGSLFVVDIDGRAVIDITCPHSPQFFTLLFPLWDWEQLSLVESSSGDLWMVHQNRSGHRRSVVFIVYKYDFDKKWWIRLSGLGDCAIFVGDNCCVCVRAPDRFKCRRNCIYFVGKERERRWPNREMFADVGVYCVEDGSCGPLDRGPESPRYYSFPIWVIPTLN